MILLVKEQFFFLILFLFKSLEKKFLPLGVESCTLMPLDQAVRPGLSDYEWPRPQEPLTLLVVQSYYVILTSRLKA